jgi:hypothetical protein
MPSDTRRLGREAGPARAASRVAALRAALLLAALCPLGGPAARAAQTRQPAAQRPAVTQAQAELYERWRSNVNTNQQVAHEAGREYLSKYPADDYAAHVRRWVAAYERESRKAEFARHFKARRFDELFRTGRAVLEEEPDHLRTIFNLAYAGYLASGRGDDTFNADALRYARRAVGLIEGGAQVADWQPFAGRDDALGYLHFIVGELTLKSDPEEAVRLFRKAVAFDASVRRTPVLYSRLAAAYVVGRYDPLSKDYSARFAGKEATDESRAALEKINVVVDLIIDAYARAVALSAAEQQYADARRRWSEELTRFYRFRHADSTDGLEAFVASVTSKPLPE